MNIKTFSICSDPVPQGTSFWPLPNLKGSKGCLIFMLLSTAQTPDPSLNPLPDVPYLLYAKLRDEYLTSIQTRWWITKLQYQTPIQTHSLSIPRSSCFPQAQLSFCLLQDSKPSPHPLWWKSMANSAGLVSYVLPQLDCVHTGPRPDLFISVSVFILKSLSGASWRL